jgi:dihydrolipoamide dehydrogenase
MPKVNEYKDGVVGRLYKGLQGMIKAAGITVVEGEGKVVGDRTVEVDGTQYTGKNLVLATGSYARTLPGLDIGGRVVTSDQALTMSEVPDDVVIIGGSVIGVEFASVWKSFGAEVTIVEALPTLVPLEDPALAKQLERAFRKRKINFKTGVKFSGVEQSESGVTVTLENGDSLKTDLVLVAVGRGPRSEGLGFEEAGITTDRGWVPTNERLHTNAEGVFAVGDLVPGLQLAHRGFAHGIFVAEEIAGLDPQPVIDSGIPRVTYCEPEVASVGLTEPQARDKYGDVDTYEYNLGGNGKSQILQTAGLVKLVREKDGPIVGVHMIGARFGEQVGEASLIVNWEAFPEDVAQFIHAHPTQNESLGEASLALAGKPLHAHA